MNEELENYQEETETIQISSEKKKYYSEPSLTALGSMQRLTLNGSEANPDSATGPGGEL